MTGTQTQTQDTIRERRRDRLKQKLFPRRPAKSPPVVQQTPRSSSSRPSSAIELGPVASNLQDKNKAASNLRHASPTPSNTEPSTSTNNSTASITSPSANSSTQINAPSPKNSVSSVPPTPTPLPNTPTTTVALQRKENAFLENSQQSPTSTPAQTPSTKAPETRNLWSEALQTLSEEEKRAIQELQPAVGTDPPKIGELLDLTQILHKKCKEGSYKFLFRGKEYIVRDIAGKIVSWLDKFKSVGDIMVNFDPVHAALPWAGVRFLLQAAVGEHEQLGELLLIIEKVSCLIKRGEVYEILYQPGLAFADDQALRVFHEEMIQLYVLILRKLTSICQLLVKSTVQRTAHSLFKPGEVSGLLRHFDRVGDNVEVAIKNCELSRSIQADTEHKTLLESVRGHILRTDENVLTMLEVIEVNERLKILDSFSSVKCGFNHETISTRRTKNTCEWIFREPGYQEWLDESASTILWLSGNVGTGKTFVVSKVIDEIQHTLEMNPNQEGFAFFYCNKNEDERRGALPVLTAFVRQLATIAREKNSIEIHMKQYYYYNEFQTKLPMIKDCKRFLLDLMNLYPRTTLILDGLDELEGADRSELVEVFEYLLTESSNPLKIFITSRPEGDILEILEDRDNIELSFRKTNEDISKFIESRIVKHRRWGAMEPGLKDQIIKTLNERSQGMFQWAYLQIEQLLKLQWARHIRDRLGKLPKDLKTSYDEIYNSMEDSEKELADRAFKWTMCSHKPLKTSLLLAAMCQDETKDTLAPLENIDESLALETFHNFLVFDRLREVWVPSHLSVVEYFETLWSQSEANCFVANTCLLVLQNTILYNRERRWKLPERFLKISFMSNRQPRELELPDPLYKTDFMYLSWYARYHWWLHVRKSSDFENNKHLIALLEAFLGLPTKSSLAYQCWYRMTLEEVKEKPERRGVYINFDVLNEIRPITIAGFGYSRLGLNIILPGWFESDWLKEDRRTAKGENYLELAVSSRSPSTCRVLIKHGSDVHANVWAKFKGYMRALTGALVKGSTGAYTDELDETIKVLVREGGAQVNEKYLAGFYGSPLCAAIESGSLSPGIKMEIVKFLVEEGADINMRCGAYGSALGTAATFGNDEILRFLLTNGANVNMPLENCEFGSALAAACHARSLRKVKLLVEAGADVNMPLDGDYGSALIWAVKFPWELQEPIARYLVAEAGADCDMQCENGEFHSALEAVFSNRCEQDEVRKMAEILVREGGANINLPLRYGTYPSALEAAKDNGWYVIAKELMDWVENEASGD